MSDPVLYSAAGGISTITLNRPDNRNSMTEELLVAFADCVQRALGDQEMRVLIIRGSGSCFSAGADFKAQLTRGGEGRVAHERSFAMYEPFLSILDIEVPVIAALNGHAIGGGFGLALLCDLRVASRDAKYGANFVKLGLHPGMAVTYLLPRLIGVPRAFEWLLTGRRFNGEQGEGAGLFNRAVPADEVVPVAEELAREVASAAPIAVRLTKRMLRRSLQWDPRSAAYDEAYAQAVTLASEDVEEGVSALLEKREPRFSGR